MIDALPIGNGSLGAMVSGGVERERLQLNEDTLWSGRPHDHTNPQAAQSLSQARRLLAEGKYEEAERTASQRMMGRPVRLQAYQPLGDLWLRFADHDRATDYRRELVLRFRTSPGRSHILRADRPDRS